MKKHLKYLKYIFRHKLKCLYWKFIYQRILANKIYNLLKTKYNRNELAKILAEWRKLRTKYDGAEYDEKGYWIH